MKAEELMIGNFVTLDDKQRINLYRNQIHASNEYFVVKTIWSDNDIAVFLDDEIVDMPADEVKPIPLTEEWLVRFGAEKRSLHYYKLNGIIICVQDFFFECYLGGINVHIKYVHTLQNLIYTLTNKHLTIK